MWTRMSRAYFLELQRKKNRKGKNKFKAKRTALGFPSKLEEAVYFKLKDREVLGEITDIKRQQVVVLQDGDRDTKINWKVDFSFIEKKTNRLCFAEAKGVETGEYRLKLKLWRALKPYPLEIWKGSWQRPFMKERIE